MANPKTLRLILGDQLNINHSWFQEINPDVVYVMMEIRAESEYVHHHIQKIACFFSAMRSFRDALTEMGHRVIYIQISDTVNEHSFEGNLRRLIESETINRFEYQLPDEYRLDQLLSSMGESLGIPTIATDSEHFLSKREGVSEHFGSKNPLMESFYRMMRRKYNIMMESGKPIGRQWNFDADNRKKYKGNPPVPLPPAFENNLQAIVEEIETANLPFIGKADYGLEFWPVTRKQSLELLQHFTEHLLPWFGTFQDAMTLNEPFVFHSRLSFAMNVKLLHPLEVIEAAVQCLENDPATYSLNQVEGFVRQILGWREFMRGIYWKEMPEFATLNYFKHQRALPEFFWTGNTKMACVKAAVKQSLNLAYAHHIQRLMITGNFALLAGIDPAEVDAWYLGIYADAIEWVQLPNTRGMSQFADGGIVGTKQYVSSANYIHKMSDYCKGCSYDRKLKYGPKACPFNSLYWQFYERNRDKLGNNPRIGMMYRVWDRNPEEEKNRILNQADEYLSNLEKL